MAATYSTGFHRSYRGRVPMRFRGGPGAFTLSDELKQGEWAHQNLVLEAIFLGINDVVVGNKKTGEDIDDRELRERLFLQSEYEMNGSLPNLIATAKDVITDISATGGVPMPTPYSIARYFN